MGSFCGSYHVQRGLFVLPKLTYRIEKGLAPLISPKELNIHYNQVHLSYIMKANHLVERMLTHLKEEAYNIRNNSEETN